jgi:amidohydrolase
MSIDLIAFRRQVHRRPELGMNTHETARLIRSHSQALGAATTVCADVGVIAEIEGAHPGPTIAVRVDIDALPVEDLSDVEFRSEIPGRCHACGHDVHAAIGLGVVQELMARRNELRGRVRVLFQPGEEVFEGAKLMIECGALDDVEAIFGVHNLPGVPVGRAIFSRERAAMAASDRFRIVVEGAGGHAASPHKTRDPIVAGAAIVTALQTICSRAIDPGDAAAVSVCRINGGTAFNIIGDSIELEGTTRHLKAQVGETVSMLLQSIAENVAKAHRCEATVEYTSMVPALVTSPAETELAMDVAAEILGKDQLVLTNPSMGSEDFALYAAQVPASYFWIGSGGEHPLHSPRYSIDETCIPLGVKLMSEIALRRLNVGRD